MKETVCVTGGSGGVGQALLELLTGVYNVKVLFRAKSAISKKWEQRGCVPVWGDLENEKALSELASGATIVFHAAATVGGSYQKSYAINVEGTRRLARVAATHGCERFVHVSSVAVYGGMATDADFTEDAELSEHASMAVYSMTKLQSELALREVAREYGLSFTILRPTSIYGPNTKSYTLIPLDLIKKGFPVILGRGRGTMDVVYVEDVAKALLLAAQSPQAIGEVFNIGHETVMPDSFYARFGQMLNRPVRHLPVSVVKAVLRVMQLLPGRQGTRRSQPSRQKEPPMGPELLHRP